MEEVHAGCLPEDKLRLIGEEQARGQRVCMLGDGINDAPALKKAGVGIAMGGVGSDIAVDAADIALVNDDICELPHLLCLAQHMMRVIRCNLTFSMALNFIAILLAMTGVLNPVVARWYTTRARCSSSSIRHFCCAGAKSRALQRGFDRKRAALRPGNKRRETL